MTSYLLSFLWLFPESACQQLYNLLENVGHHAQKDRSLILLILLILVCITGYAAVCHLLQSWQHGGDAHVAQI